MKLSKNLAMAIGASIVSFATYAYSSTMSAASATTYYCCDTTTTTPDSSQCGGSMWCWDWNVNCQDTSSHYGGGFYYCSE